jgi:hypothetical protein
MLVQEMLLYVPQDNSAVIIWSLAEHFDGGADYSVRDLWTVYSVV